MCVCVCVCVCVCGLYRVQKQNEECSSIIVNNSIIKQD